MNKVSFDDFKKLDIRMGTVVEAEVPKWSHWVIKLTTDFGLQSTDKNKKYKTIFAGLLGFYKPEDLKGKQFPFVVNMEPKKIGPEGDFSEGMMLAVSKKLDKPVLIAGDPTSLKLRGASEETDEKPVLLCPLEKVANGSKVR